MDMELKFEIRGICYAVISDETVEVTRNRDTDSEVVIPERVAYEGKNYQVKKIGIQAFYGNRALTIAWKQSVFQSIFWESNIPKSSPKELLRTVNVVEWIV